MYSVSKVKFITLNHYFIRHKSFQSENGFEGFGLQVKSRAFAFKIQPQIGNKESNILRSKALMCLMCLTLSLNDHTLKSKTVYK